MSSKRIKFLILIFVIVALVFAYFLFYSKKEDAGTESNVAVTSNGPIGANGAKIDAEGNELLGMSESLKGIKIDPGFFDSFVFKSLIDNSVELPPVPAGRVNPFAPVR